MYSSNVHLFVRVKKKINSTLFWISFGSREAVVAQRVLLSLVPLHANNVYSIKFANTY